MYNFIEDIEKKGIDLGKKIFIYDAYKKGYKLEELAQFASLPVSEIVEIIEEMKQWKPSNGVN